MEFIRVRMKFFLDVMFVDVKLIRTLTMQLSVNLAGDIFLNFVLSAAVEVNNRCIVVD